MAVTELNALCRQALVSRTLPADFVKTVQQRRATEGKALAKALLDCRQSLCHSSDPLPPRYLERLLSLSILNLTDLLVVLISRWNALCRSKPPRRSSEADVMTIQELALLIMSSRFVLARDQVRMSLLLVARWLSALAKVAGQNETAETSRAVEPLGSLLATLCATNTGVELLSGKEEDKTTKVTDTVRQAVDAALGLFPAISGQLVDRLSEVQKHIDMFADNGSSDLQAMQFQNNIAPLQMAASRAGTAAMLQSFLYTAHTVDDTVVFNFLEGRHSSDYASMFLDLVFASFLVLKQSSGTVLTQTEIYIRNKLPAILSRISTSSFESFSSEQALNDTWGQLELSTEHLMTGKKFMHACSLHHLIPTDSVTKLVNDQELTDSLPTSLETKEELVSQITANHARSVKLVDELLQTVGNGSAVGQALAEMMVAYSHSKETQHLKDVANVLVRKPMAINALALFLRPSGWIGPLCTLLDEWKWDEIHGESQPLYDEFGSVMLLILTTKRRLGYTTSELGIKGFVARYLDQEGIERSMGELSQPTVKHLGEWINALYVAEGLSDDLTTNCSPQEFYMLIPTLIRQSVVAQQHGKLTGDAFKAGMEYLLEPFLLPSLVSAISWCQQHSNIGKQIIPIFAKSTGNEVHQTILSMLQSPKGFCSRYSEKTTLRDLSQKIALAISSPALSSGIFIPSAVEMFGADAVLQVILDVLLQHSGSADFLFALDLVATLVCVGGLRDVLRLRHANLGKLLKTRDTLTAEAVVHLSRRVEDYAIVFVVQETNMDIIALPNMDTTVDTTADQNQEQQMDDIDQMLNDSAAMNALENNLGSALDDPMTQNDNMDSFYLQDDNMGLGNLDDLDLDMF